MAGPRILRDTMKMPAMFVCAHIRTLTREHGTGHARHIFVDERDCQQDDWQSAHTVQQLANQQHHIVHIVQVCGWARCRWRRLQRYVTRTPVCAICTRLVFDAVHSVFAADTCS
jgi:hypothetical protein